MENAIHFGEFIKRKRQEHNITLRAMADEIKVSPAYLSDIENNRRYPMDNEKISQLIEIFKLSTEEQEEMYDLAGRARNEVSPDLPEYIMEQDIVRVALRKAKEKATQSDWEKFIDDLDKKG